MRYPEFRKLGLFVGSGVVGYWGWDDSPAFSLGAGTELPKQRHGRKSNITNKTKDAQTLIHRFLARGEVSCVTCSFQTEDIALVHMIIREEPGIA